MRAAVLTNFGGAHALKVLENIPLPVCREHEVLVKVAAAAINPIDCRIRAGYGGDFYGRMLPLVLGRDVSGEVVSAGSSARKFSIGTQVFGALSALTSRGSHAEYVDVPEAHLTEKPDCLTHEEASAIPFAALTAWRALFVVCRVQKGDRILIIGGDSSVGTAAVQLAQACGCQVAASRRPNSLSYKYLRRSWVDYSNDDHILASAVNNINLKRSGVFDVVFDTTGAHLSALAKAELLRTGTGQYVTLHGMLASSVEENGFFAGGTKATFELARRKVTHRINVNTQYHWSVSRQDASAIAEIGQLARSGLLQIDLGTKLPLFDIARAHLIMEGSAHRGKVVILP